MDYFLTKHAQQRAEERSISIALIEDAIAQPTKVLYDNQGKLLIKKHYAVQGKERLLLMVGTRIGDRLKIITIIDTSKASKYL